MFSEDEALILYSLLSLDTMSWTDRGQHILKLVSMTQNSLKFYSHVAKDLIHNKKYLDSDPYFYAGKMVVVSPISPENLVISIIGEIVPLRIDASEIIKIIAENPRSSEKVLALCLDFCEPRIAQKVAAHKNLYPERVVGHETIVPNNYDSHYLLDNFEIRSGFVTNPNVSVWMLEKGAVDESSFVREAVAKNVYTPLMVVKELAKDENRYVRNAAMLHPKYVRYKKMLH